MASIDDNIDYGYENKDWVPGLGNQSRPPASGRSLSLGYHDENLLRNLIKEIQAMARATITVAEKELEKYSLTVEADSRLEQAQAQEWPTDLGEPRTYVSYQEYKALEPLRSRGAEYIRKSYEDGIRGPFGTNAIDVITSVSAIKNEADNIEEFLDNYMGEVNGTSEFRALELLQDWAESAVEHTRRVGAVFTERTKSPVQIPTAELDNLGETDARNYQAFFQTKVNAVNKEIRQLTDDVQKEYNQMSEIYYKKYLGPALKFQRQVGTPMSRNVAVETFLGTQAAQADQAMAANYVTLLADQMKRNENFENKMANLITRIRVRDNYAGFTRQLNVKLEKETPSPFVDTPIGAVERAGLEAYFVAAEAQREEDNEFTSAHAMLDGRDEDDAHEQYLLKAGDTITGDILMNAGIKIGGMEPKVHRHRGPEVDGTEKIHGEDIVDLVTTAINKDEVMCLPINLRHINNQPQTGANNVTLVNSQVSWECDPNLTFELQTVPVKFQSTAVAESSYCVTTLYETGLDIIAGIGSDFGFFTFATPTAVYQYNWTTGLLKHIAGEEGTFGDAVGDSLVKARFSNISDITQDFYDGRIYIIDGDNRKIKYTGSSAVTGTTLPTDVKLAYTAPYDIKRADAQGQNFMNTLYVLIGPDGGGKDHVIKLIDIDGNNLQAGTYQASTITKLSGVYSNAKDIAVTPNGNVYLLVGTNLYQYDPNSNSVRTHNIADESGATPTAITSDQYNSIYITYSST